jgi:SAM-dependent methyltransferase
MEGLLYAYGAPNVVSEQQRKYIRERVRQQLAEKASRNVEGAGKVSNSLHGNGEPSEDRVLQRQRMRSDSGSNIHGSTTTTTDRNGLTRVLSESSATSGNYHYQSSSGLKHTRDVSGDMDPRATNMSSISSRGSTASSSQERADWLANPFELRHGRRYLRDTAYPLPCDLAEIQRQNLRTLLGCSVLGRPACAPSIEKKVPQRVLELGCGGAYWSARCHEYFTSLGHRRVAFTGMDVAPLAPDLKKQGINWTFLQHDIRNTPWPFEDETFDLIMFKDLSMVIGLGAAQQIMDECIRLLKVGGILEVWDCDYVLRSLLPHPSPPTGKNRKDHELAMKTGTFLISPGTPFAPAQNKFITEQNTWITAALNDRKLPPVPCARVAQILYQEPESLGDVGMHRVAIPLGDLRWERERDSHHHGRSKSEAMNGLGAKGKIRLGIVDQSLTNEQAAIRQTALLTVIQLIESMEPLLKEASNKNTEEWSYWWASMMADMMDPNRGALNGECLEVGAWWATKIADTDTG